MDIMAKLSSIHLYATYRCITSFKIDISSGGITIIRFKDVVKIFHIGKNEVTFRLESYDKYMILSHDLFYKYFELDYIDDDYCKSSMPDFIEEEEMTL